MVSYLEKRYLFTPGPTPVPPEVLAASAEPMVHHRGPDFRDIYARTLSRLKDVYRTDSDVLLFTASGTGAMESAVANLTEAGQRVAVVSHGSFGERWVAIGERYGLDVQAIRYEWGESPDPAEVGAAVRDSGAEIVFCQQSDTSTGVVSDVREDSRGRRRRDARRRCDLVARRGAAGDGRVGDRRGHLRFPESADEPARARDGVGARARAREGETAAHLLLRLAREQEGAGRPRRPPSRPPSRSSAASTSRSG